MFGFKQVRGWRRRGRLYGLSLVTPLFGPASFAPSGHSRDFSVAVAAFLEEFKRTTKVDCDDFALAALPSRHVL